MHVTVPIFLSDRVVDTKVEIQIRTIAMDFWASFEHKVKYKTEQEVNKKTSKELVNCAKMISKFDDKMISLKNIQ